MIDDLSNVVHCGQRNTKFMLKHGFWVGLEDGGEGAPFTSLFDDQGYQVHRLRLGHTFDNQMFGLVRFGHWSKAIFALAIPTYLQLAASCLLAKIYQAILLEIHPTWMTKKVWRKMSTFSSCVKRVSWDLLWMTKNVMKMGTFSTCLKNRHRPAVA